MDREDFSVEKKQYAISAKLFARCASDSHSEMQGALLRWNMPHGAKYIAIARALGIDLTRAIRAIDKRNNVFSSSHSTISRDTVNRALRDIEKNTPQRLLTDYDRAKYIWNELTSGFQEARKRLTFAMDALERGDTINDIALGSDMEKSAFYRWVGNIGTGSEKPIESITRLHRQIRKIENIDFSPADFERIKIELEGTREATSEESDRLKISLEQNNGQMVELWICLYKSGIGDGKPMKEEQIYNFFKEQHLIEPDITQQTFQTAYEKARDALRESNPETVRGFKTDSARVREILGEVPKRKSLDTSST